mgnify:CR=1 FL=1
MTQAKVTASFALGYSIGNQYGSITRRQAEMYLNDALWGRTLSDEYVDVLMNGVDDGAAGDNWRLLQP